MGRRKKKFRIQDAEFAVLIGGPYDGLKLSRVGSKSKILREPQIGLPTPQYLNKIEEPDLAQRASDVVYDIVFEEGYEENPTPQYLEFEGEEVIAVYTATPRKKKYSEVFDTIPRKLKKLSTILNVTIFKFDFYARFRDINEVE